MRFSTGEIIFGGETMRFWDRLGGVDLDQCARWDLEKSSFFGKQMQRELFNVYGCLQRTVVIFVFCRGPAPSSSSSFLPKTTCEFNSFRFTILQMLREANALSPSAGGCCLIVVDIDVQLCLARHLHYCATSFLSQTLADKLCQWRD